MNTQAAIQHHYQQQFNAHTRDNLIIHPQSHTILEITPTHITIIKPHPTLWNTLIRTNFHHTYNDQISQRNQNSTLNHLRKTSPTTILELTDPTTFDKIDKALQQ